MRVLVVTVVHVPLDARIYARQIAALLEAGCEVTYVAPWAATGTAKPDTGGLAALDVPRATGRRRLGALRAARRLLRQHAPGHDLVLLHDPELLLVAGAAGVTPVVWDVHEDVSASLVARPWVPSPLVGFLQRVARWVEARAERRHHLILAEHAYQERFKITHPVVPNVPRAPAEVSAPGDDRAVYVGRVARARGAMELIEVGRRLRGELTVEVIGDAETDVQVLLEEAHARGDVQWLGFVPNPEALRRIDGAMAGLSLLHDLPNFRGSMPTKVVEYLACGLPVVTTPLPLAAALVEACDGGHVVGFGDIDAVVAALRMLQSDPKARSQAAQRGRSHVLAHHSWEVEGARFVATLQGWQSSVDPT
jgi:glycosyltransferase involved in cell wall biosynthesis